MTKPENRENIEAQHNPLGIHGIEYIEYATSQPQALGRVLEMMGFSPIARHRSREVVLYRQGSMNLVVNAHPDDARVSASAGGEPVISAVAFRVKDALKALTHCLELGAWEVKSQAHAMELHIPAIHGPGSSRFYFVDRWDEFSIYDIDFLPIPSVNAHPPALAEMSYFGLVQYVGTNRSADWICYFQRLLGFSLIPEDQRFGILPRGELMKSPCGTFLWQLVEPYNYMDLENPKESLQRIGIGAPDVPAAVAQLKTRGVEFVELSKLHPEDRGALTRDMLGSVSFELVHKERA